MKTFQAKRLLKLADKLDSVPRREFDITRWYKEGEGCGTVACACGWACSIPSFRRAGLGLKPYPEGHPQAGTGKYLVLTYRDGYELEQFAASQEFFGLSLGEAEAMFSCNGYENGRKVTPKQVAAKIRRFVRTKYPKLVRERTAA